MRRAGIAVAALMLSAAAAMGQQPKRGFDPEAFREMLVKTAAEYYKLDDGQRDALRTLLQDRTAGMQEKWAEVGKVFREAREKAEAGEQVDWEAVREKARPQFDEVRKFMDETNGLFRDKILNDDQKKQFDEAKTKGLDPFSGRERPQFGQSPTERLARRFTGKGFEEENWKGWLDRIGKAAKMSEEQLAKATDMLKLASEAAAEYRRGKEAEYKKLAAELAEINKDRNADADKRKALLAAGQELTAPIDGIEKKWKEDVMGLLNDEQKKAAQAADRRGGFGGQGGRRPPQQN